MNLTRRTLLWSIPTVTTACAAPAYATSHAGPEPDPAPVYMPVGCRVPGRKTYHLRLDELEGVEILKVVLDEAVAAKGSHGWTVTRDDSRIGLPVVVTTTAGQWAGMVDFPVCKHEN